METCALNAVPFEWRDIGVMSTAIALPAHSSPASRASLGSQKPLPVRVLGPEGWKAVRCGLEGRWAAYAGTAGARGGAKWLVEK